MVFANNNKNMQLNWDLCKSFHCLCLFNQNGFKMLRDRTPKAPLPDIGIVVLQHHDDWNLLRYSETYYLIKIGLSQHYQSTKSNRCLDRPFWFPVTFGIFTLCMGLMIQICTIALNCKWKYMLSYCKYLHTCR